VELSPEPHSPPATAELEREVEQLKIEVACWKGHCLDAEIQAKELRFYFTQCLLGQRQLDRELHQKLAAPAKRKESTESQDGPAQQDGPAHRG